jgi:hypothetical protein
MSRATVVYTHGGGRLGNQLIRFAHWIAWTREHANEVEVLNFAFWPYAALFATWSESPACISPVRPTRVGRLAQVLNRLPPRLRTRLQAGYRVARGVHRLGTRIPGWQAIELDDKAGESIDLDDPCFLEKVRPYAVSTCAGWKISTWRLVEAYEPELRELFRPATPWMERGRQFIETLRLRHDCAIGVLIRQTDYRQWWNGRFYYSTEDYARWMQQLLDLGLYGNTAIVIASDERQNPEAFSGLPCYFAPGAVNEGGHWFDSFVALSRCDLIVSPPSTFSAAAAFVGNVPLLPLTDSRQALRAHEILPRALIQAARHPVFSLAVK